MTSIVYVYSIVIASEKTSTGLPPLIRRKGDNQLEERELYVVHQVDQV